jgi:hypothetical protein
MAGKFEFMGECWGFMRQRKRYWLLPLIVIFFFIGILLIFAQTSAAPFIYTLF